MSLETEQVLQKAEHIGRVREKANSIVWTWFRNKSAVNQTSTTETAQGEHGRN